MPQDEYLHYMEPSAEPNKAASPKPAPPPEKKRRGGRMALRVLGVLGVLVLSLAGLAFGAITVVCKGPFPTAKEMFVVSVSETSAVKFLARIYCSAQEVEEILQRNALLPPDEVTDIRQPFAQAETAGDAPDIEITEVFGSTFKGKMMIVKDPSRLRLATISSFGEEVSGRKIEQLVADSGAVAGINAGGFADEGGVGKGGQPLGLLMREGRILCGSASASYSVIGLSFDHHLVVGEMTGQAAVDLGVRDAVCFGPALIVNGTPAEVGGSGGGVNPRTCIGQRADGAILLLVIDGRQPHSIGATMEDCLRVMQDFDAVNASNLDGGSSSIMVYEGEIINVCASLYGSRNQPAAFVVDALTE